MHTKPPCSHGIWEPPQVIPIHHLLWADRSNSADETLDPNLFVETYTSLGGRGIAIIPQVGIELDFEP